MDKCRNYYSNYLREKNENNNTSCANRSDLTDCPICIASVCWSRPSKPSSPSSFKNVDTFSVLDAYRKLLKINVPKNKYPMCRKVISRRQFKAQNID